MIQAQVKDKNRCWRFLITEQEYEQIKEGSLQLYWDQRVRKGIDESGWCLVTKEQRARLLDWTGGDMDVWIMKMFNREGSPVVSLVSSIKFLKDETTREYTKIKRKPLK